MRQVLDRLERMENVCVFARKNMPILHTSLTVTHPCSAVQEHLKPQIVPYITYICIIPALLLHYFAKGRDKCLRQPEGEHKLRSSHEQLRRQSLEERGETFMFHHVGHNLEATLGVLEVPVLDAGLDNIEGSGDDKRGAGTGD